MLTLEYWLPLPSPAPRLVVFSEPPRPWGAAEVRDVAAGLVPAADAPEKVLALAPGAVAFARLRVRSALFATGAHRLPALGVRVVGGAGGAGAPQSIAIPQTLVVVTPLIPPGQEQLEIKDAKQPRPLPWGLTFWIVLGLALAGFAAAVVQLVRALTAVRPQEAEDSATPPYDEALATLAALAAERHDDPESIRMAHFALAQAARRFIERRLGVPALERTTSELARELEGRYPAELWGREARVLLRAADWSKFGRQPAAAADLEARLASARQLVDSIENAQRAAEKAAAAAIAAGPAAAAKAS